MDCEKNCFCNCDGSCRFPPREAWKNDLADIFMRSVAEGRQAVANLPPITVREFEQIMRERVGS